MHKPRKNFENLLLVALSVVVQTGSLFRVSVHRDDEQGFDVLRKRFVVMLKINTKGQFLRQHIGRIGIHTEISRNINAANDRNQKRRQQYPKRMSVGNASPICERTINVAM